MELQTYNKSYTINKLTVVFDDILILCFILARDYFLVALRNESNINKSNECNL